MEDQNPEEILTRYQELEGSCDEVLDWFRESKRQAKVARKVRRRSRYMIGKAEKLVEAEGDDERQEEILEEMIPTAQSINGLLERMEGTEGLP